MANHAKRKHAMLSASGAHRWLNCTPSARLEEEYEDTTSDYAKEGTLAHELAELELRAAVKAITNKQRLAALKKIQASEYWSDEMPEYVETYTTYVLNQHKAARREHNSAELLIEDKIDLTHYIPEGFGTNDAVIISDVTLEVCDLKYGRGVAVSAHENEQLMLYGLGALRAHELLYDIETVRVTVIQPRLDSISSYELSADELRTWAEKIVIPRAQQAFEGEGELVAGDHCRWCKAKNRCPALAEHNARLARHEFAKPDALSDEELVEAYEQISAIQDWLKSISSYMLTQALEGRQWPGYKLVEGRSNRKWRDEDAVISALRKAGYKNHEIVNVKPKGITDMTKLLGKKGLDLVLGEHIIKPPGSPTLAPEDDKRPAMGVEQAKKDFA